ncbi:hypothetical protein Tco_0953932 [Tanacetum coccineum]|uniref:Secreted protein n=1 Tax=Tanacetum coccineum TaxID=301880 RepID=A0ABQ5E205_9ASTR
MEMMVRWLWWWSSVGWSLTGMEGDWGPRKWGGDDAGGVIRCGGDIGDGVRRLVMVADDGGWPELGRSDAGKMRGGSGG